MFLSDIKYVPIKLDLHAAEVASEKPINIFFFLERAPKISMTVVFNTYCTLQSLGAGQGEEEMSKKINVSAISLEIETEYLGVGEGFTPQSLPSCIFKAQSGGAPQPLIAQLHGRGYYQPVHVRMQVTSNLVGHFATL